MKLRAASEPSISTILTTLFTNSNRSKFDTESKETVGIKPWQIARNQQLQNPTHRIGHDRLVKKQTSGTRPSPIFPPHFRTGIAENSRTDQHPMYPSREGSNERRKTSGGSEDREPDRIGGGEADDRRRPDFAAGGI